MSDKNQRLLNLFVSSLTHLVVIIKDMKRIILVLSLCLLAACAAETAVEPATQPAPTAVFPTTVAAIEVSEPTAVLTHSPVPTDEPAQSEPPEPTPLPPAEPAPTAVTEPDEVVVAYGRTEEGAYFKGAANALVTLIDYSDFL
jgi:hypothetical protein